VSTPSSSSRRRASGYAEDVSPADTFDTALTLASTRTDDTETYTHSPSTVSTNKIIIDHNINTSNSGDNSGIEKNRSSGKAVSGLIFGMSKPILGIVMMSVLGAGAAAALGWMQIPGLKTQVEALEDQVELLTAEVDRLSAEVDRLENANDRYEYLNDQLNSTVIDLDEIGDGLNETALSLEEKVYQLLQENRIYASLNEDLNDTVAELSTEVDYFKAALADLTLENSILSNMTVTLQALSDELLNTTLAQNETLAAIQDTLEDFATENDRLKEFNRDLVTLVKFLNETSSGLGDSLENITSFLTDQIDVNRGLVVESLENTYRQRVQNWDCEYRDVFGLEPFGQNFSLPLDRTVDLPAVLEYVEQRVLSELCLDRSNFGTYLDALYPLADDAVITSFGFIRAVRVYTDLALEYYFPDVEDVGLIVDDWSNASFQCEQLPVPFVWTT
jgi:cell division septum initiation protein DivIVA